MNCSTFENSFFYIGPGKDFEPLLRFSHMCTNYFFPNLFMSKEEIMDYAERFFNEHQNFLEVLSCDVFDDFKEETFFDLHPSYKQHLADVRFMEHHHQNYKHAFAKAISDPQWMLHYTLKRKGVNRTLHLYYFTSEGLAAYMALSHNGRYTPSIFCTIETKVLERGTGIVEKMFQQLKSYPFCWIKGFEPEEYFSWYDYFYHETTYPLKSNSDYSALASDFIFHWNAEGTYVKSEYDLKTTSRRFCKAFVRKDEAHAISSKTYPEFNGHSKLVRGSLLDIINEYHVSGEKSIVILTRNLYRMAHKIPDGVACLYWEDIMRYYDRDNFLSKYSDLGDGIEKNKYSMSQSLQRLDSYLLEHIKDQPAKVFLIPFGLEDEGILLADWLNKKKEGPAFIAAVHRTMDCIDLLRVEE